MLEEERRGDVARMLEENRGVATGTIIATALAAAAIAYMLRRSREEEERRIPAGAGRAWDRARDLVGDERIEAGREFLVEKVVPEFKPVLLALLKDLREVSDDWFRQAEKSIKRM